MPSSPSHFTINITVTETTPESETSTGYKTETKPREVAELSRTTFRAPTLVEALQLGTDYLELLAPAELNPK